ncbi:hypothetical protein [Pseudobdellovibrio exovorus]|uniref:Uncharacterized protein n=1 Tax=Pseudobdellovibrio exovorus JSS TaxID=1184267 RepID=M4VE60_9BACT|nr:hypothetical protein [Pseudobdellovibrio exovorus]AGH96331.1 hypothetical protein A11Q_2115 [Pseudobdellovibrio exovorus JSS]
MTLNPLPPQAYTKETLQKAYSWLLTQPASVKDMATSQDILVSLYLKAQRNGEASLEAPSIQNFKQELKQLASMIGDLQTPAQSAPVAAPTMPKAQPQTTLEAPTAQTRSLPVTGLPLSFKETVNQAAHAMGNMGGGSSSSLGQLDIQSLQALSEVRQTLNLSSDIEALRALIALGYKQFKKM